MMYRTNTGEQVSLVKRHLDPTSSDGYWATIEHADGHRSDLPPHLLTEVRDQTPRNSFVTRLCRIGRR